MSRLIAILIVVVVLVTLLAPSASAWDSNIRYRETLRNPIYWEADDGGWGGETKRGLGDGYMPNPWYNYCFVPFAWEFWSWWMPRTPATSFWSFRTVDAHQNRVVDGVLLP